MKLIQKKDNQVIIRVEMEEVVANAVRRYLNQIPILAIDEVEISKNDSPLYDETVAHRLGLVPLKIGKEVNDKTEEKLKLGVKDEGTVYSGELKGSVKPVYDKIPITSLKKGQEIEAVGIAKVGMGKEHAKFSPGLMFYRNIVDLKIEKDCPKEVVDVCPKKILKNKDGKIVVEDSVKCDMCEACIEICNKNKKDSIKIIPGNELIVTIESFGQIEIKDMIKKSVNGLKKDLALVSKKIGK